MKQLINNNGCSHSCSPNRQLMTTNTEGGVGTPFIIPAVTKLFRNQYKEQNQGSVTNWQTKYQIHRRLHSTTFLNRSRESDTREPNDCRVDSLTTISSSYSPVVYSPVVNIKLFEYLQDEEKKMISTISRKEEQKKREMNKLVAMKV